MRINNDGKPDRRPFGRIPARWLLSGLLLFIAVAATLLWTAFGRSEPENPRPAVPPETENLLPAPDSVHWEKPERVADDSAVRNLLLVGQDRRPGEERARADAIVLCSVNENSDTITLVSLLRDMYVPIPGHPDDRLNAAFALGGTELLRQTVEQALGVAVYGILAVDFDGFVSAVAAAAPLEIELTAEEAAYLNADGGWALQEGPALLDERQLLSYVRIRSVGQDDFRRSQRQRKVILTAFQKLRVLPVPELFNLAQGALSCISTDLDSAELLDLLFKAVTRHMTMTDGQYIPADGAFSEETIRGMAVLLPDLAENSRILRQTLYGK